MILTAFALSNLVHAADVPASVDSDGNIHVRELIIPPSALWSSAFRKYSAARMVENYPRMPARNAPRTEWQRYNRLVDRVFYAERLARARELYPVNVLDTKVAGVHAGIVTPQGAVAPENRHRILINVRGGGFVQNEGLSFGLLDSIPVSAIGRIEVITLDYRQAPFYSYPAATEDVEAVYRDLLKHYKAEAIGIYGCSAGGALTAQAVAWFQARNLPRPGAVGIHCTAPSPSWGLRGGDSDFWRGRLPKDQHVNTEKNSPNPATWYMDSAALDDPQAYPETSDAVLARFPPTMFLTGTRAFEMSATVITHARFLKLGVDSSLYVMEGASHADHVYAIGTPEAHDAYAYIAHWFRQHLAQ